MALSIAWSNSRKAVKSLVYQAEQNRVVVNLQTYVTIVKGFPLSIRVRAALRETQEGVLGATVGDWGIRTTEKESCRQ